jgi:tetratricopeptide (TPR) repeat protein
VKRRVVLFLLVCALLFAAVTLRKVSRGEQQEDIGPDRSAERSRLTAFWQLYSEATTARTKGQYEPAAELYARALEISPDHDDCLYYLGNCFFDAGEYRKAAEQYRRLIRTNPDSQRALSQLGVTLSTLAPAAPFDAAEAREAFQRSLALNSEETGPFLRLGLLSLQVGEPDSALEFFRTAAGFRSPEGYFQSGFVLFGQGRYQEAASLFLEVLKLNAREKAISGRGVLSEGDLATSRLALTPLEAAGVKALLYLAWTAERTGGYSPDMEAQFRMQLSDHEGPLRIRSRKDFETMIRRAHRLAWADFDSDGKPDLALVSTGRRIELYRNVGGALVEVGRSSGLGSSNPAWDVVWGDYDGDGRADLYAVRPGDTGIEQNTLYRNTVSGFHDVTAITGLLGARPTSRARFLDFDQDGRLDLIEVGHDDSAAPSLRLYRNQSNGGFLEVSQEAGLALHGSVTDCAVADFNSDRLPDLAVVRWKKPVLLFLNAGDGTFQRPITLANSAARSYSAVALDFNRDSHQDLLLTTVASYELAVQNLIRPELPWPAETPRLLLGKGDGTFRDATAETALDRCHGVVHAAAADLDGDGWVDLVFANGGREPHRLEPTVVLRNEAGKRLRLMSYLPNLHRPVPATAVTIQDSDQNGKPEIWLAGVGVFEP